MGIDKALLLVQLTCAKFDTAVHPVLMIGSFTAQARNEMMLVRYYAVAWRRAHTSGGPHRGGRQTL